jgi:NAD(P)-dependent dehydrogenase (short-subunit alcohol dehydrogenase family)
VIFFVNLPMGLVGLYLVYRHLPDYRAEQRRTSSTGSACSLRLGRRAPLVRPRDLRRAHAERGAIAGSSRLASVLLSSAMRGTRARRAHPLLRLTLFRIRTLRAAVTGSFVTRLGVGGMPFLLPLLYQVGLGYTPIQSGLLIMPQSLAAISLKMTMPRILTRFGYRRVLLSNTVLLGLLIVPLRHGGPRRPSRSSCLQAVAFGFLSSLQFTSMNTLVYADVASRHEHGEHDRQHDAADVDELRRRAASLTTALFIPDRFPLRGDRDDPRHPPRDKGTIINVSSGLAFVPLTAAPIYSATKAAIHAYTITLRQQLQSHGVEVIELMPPAVKTDLADYPDEPSFKVISTDELMAATFGALGKGTLEIRPGQPNSLRFMSRVAPAFIQAQLEKGSKSLIPTASRQ